MGIIFINLKGFYTIITLLKGLWPSFRDWAFKLKSPFDICRNFKRVNKIIMFKKFLVGLAVVTFLVTGFSFPGRGLAQQSSVDISALQAQIQALLQMIQQLQSQLNAMQGGGGGSDVVNPTSNPYGLPGSGSVTKPSLGLYEGTRVQAKDYLRVRVAANGAAVVTVAPGIKGTAAGKSVWQDGYWWAEIYWDNRTRGFSVEDYLEITKQNITGVCGDLNGDGVVNVQDTIWIGLYVNGGAPIPTGVNADVNADGKVDILDRTLIEDYALRNGPALTCITTAATTVLSPNGGEVWSQGSVYSIRWNLKNGGSNNGRNIAINLIDFTPGSRYGTQYAIRDGSVAWGSNLQDSSNITSGFEYFAWNIPVSVPPGSYYKVFVGDVTPWNGPAAPRNTDDSDGYFTIVANTVQPPNQKNYSVCGDIDGNGLVNQNDLDNPVSENDLTGYAFGGVPVPKEVNPDLNGDGVLNILDVTLMVNYLNRGGAAPTCTMKVNAAPKITGLPALPSRIEAGQNVNLSWTATDADNDPLQWNVTWGDGGVGACSTNCGNQYYGVHTWTTAGSYKVEAKAYDGKAWSQPHSFTIEVLPMAQKATSFVSSGFICGDVDQDGLIGSADLTKLNQYVFEGLSIPDNKLVDLNSDGYPDIIDVTLLTNFVNRGGVAPTCGGQGSQAPTITNLSGPTIFYRSADKVWSITATDPEGSQISYSIDWGDGEKSVSAYTGVSGSPVSISHRYSKGGKFTIRATATDNTGLAAVKSFRVEVGVATLLVTDFYGRTGASFGLSQGDMLLARDATGVLSGMTTVLEGGAFLLHAYGNDPITPDFDEGLTSGETVKFYKGTTLCTLVSGNAVFSGAMGSNKEVVLNCSGSTTQSSDSSSGPAASALDSIGNQLNEISQTLNNLLMQIGL